MSASTILEPGPQLRVGAHLARGLACHELHGDLDHEAAAAARIEPMAGATAVELDLRGVTYVDSAGLHLLVDLADAYGRRGVPTRMTIGTRPVVRAFAAVGLDEAYAVDVVRAGAS